MVLAKTFPSANWVEWRNHQEWVNAGFDCSDKINDKDKKHNGLKASIWGAMKGANLTAMGEKLKKQEADSDFDEVELQDDEGHEVAE